MRLTRKEFLKKGLQSLVEALLNPAVPAEPVRAERHRLRPPGYIAGRGVACRECEKCVTACPEGLLARVEAVDGPVFIPTRGGCRFCLSCAAVCPAGVLALPVENERLVIGCAVADNERCLAQRGGCFSCLERCPEQAIAIEAGVGVTVDRERCTGCGICEHICPVATKAVSVVPLLDIS